MTNIVRPGDWHCTACSFNNFASRTICKNCLSSRGPVPELPGQWNCKNCPGIINLPSRDTCFNCRFPKEAVEADAAASSTNKRARTDQGVVAVSSTTEGTVVSAAPTVPHYLLSIDIERVGPHFKYGVLAIGVCFGTSDGKIIEQRDFCSRVPPPEEFDPVCYNEMWSKHPAILARIDAAAVDDHIGKFHAWLVELEAKYGPFGRKHKEKVVFNLVSDNPAYDLGMINLEFYKKGIVLPIAEMFDSYVSTNDPSEQIRGLTNLQKDAVNGFITAPHDHWPVNDATESFQQMCGIIQVLKRTK